MNKLIPLAIAALVASTANPALAHITLAQTEAAAGSAYKGVLLSGVSADGTKVV